jgi:CBS domain-containing protein
MVAISAIMTRDVFTLPASATLDEAAFALSTRRIGGAPVRDEGGHIVGVLSRADLTDPERVGTAKTAGELMTPGFVAVHESDPAIDAVRLMVSEDAHRLLILDERGELVGIVTATDLVRALASQEPPVEEGPEGTGGGDHEGPVTIH